MGRGERLGLKWKQLVLIFFFATDLHLRHGCIAPARIQLLASDPSVPNTTISVTPHPGHFACGRALKQNVKFVGGTFCIPALSIRHNLFFWLSVPDTRAQIKYCCIWTVTHEMNCIRGNYTVYSTCIQTWIWVLQRFSIFAKIVFRYSTGWINFATEICSSYKGLIFPNIS